MQIRITGLELEEIVALEGDVLHIGRDAACEIHLDHPGVLKRHAQLVRAQDGWTLVAQKGRRGVKVNGERIEAETAVALQAGDVVQIRPFTLTLETAAEGGETDGDQPAILAQSPPAPPPPPPPSDGSPPSSILPPAMLSAPPPPPDHYGRVPPGLDRHSVRYLDYLPEIYHSDFTSRFLAMLEAILMPVEWNISNFDLFLGPDTAPTTFLPWLASWFGIIFDPTWGESKRRTFLHEANHLYARRGTKGALRRILEIYTGHTPEINDLEDEQDPFTFTVRLPLRERDVNRELIEKMIDAYKPAHTSYRLVFSTKADIDVVFSKLESE